MSFNLFQILSHMGPLGMVIAGFLIVMAIACIGVVIERLVMLSRAKKESRAFAADAKLLIDEWCMDELAKVAKERVHSPLAGLLGAVAARYAHAIQHRSGGMKAAELARNEAERAKEAVGEDLRRGMSILATTGSIAPFIGLLGTVVGIIAAFQGIAASGSGGIGAISAGIAEALVETALGLLVAIPAVLMFNFLTGRINTLELALSRSVGELLDEMEDHDGDESGQRLAAAA
ncbi:MAG: MotA/TolQ/ExbB proton channel family protein [Myxococcales bacterium]|nr:MotA/TolQ/ExbB proton channel family protein [Myxococcales bacterium]